MSTVPAGARDAGLALGERDESGCPSNLDGFPAVGASAVPSLAVWTLRSLRSGALGRRAPSRAASRGSVLASAVLLRHGLEQLESGFHLRPGSLALAA